MGSGIRAASVMSPRIAFFREPVGAAVAANVFAAARSATTTPAPKRNSRLSLRKVSILNLKYQLALHRLGNRNTGRNLCRSRVEMSQLRQALHDLEASRRNRRAIEIQRLQSIQAAQ